jgi:small subunit ribosomal protein S21
VGNALVNGKAVGERRFNPKNPVRTGCGCFFYFAKCLNYSCEHPVKFGVFAFCFGLGAEGNLYLRSKNFLKEVLRMLIIDSKDCENIDKALKKYKKKFEKAKILLQLRERQSFTKPSVKRRGEVLKAVYKQKIASGKIEP